MVTQVYDSTKSKDSIQLKTQSGSRAKLHTSGIVRLVDTLSTSPEVGVVEFIIDDDVDNILSEGVTLKVKSDIDDDDTIKVMFPNGAIEILKGWHLKASCTEIIKIFSEDTNVDKSNMLVTR